MPALDSTVDIPSLVSQFMQGLTGGLTSFATGIGGGLNAMVQSALINSERGDLNFFGAIVAIFGGVSLCIGLTKFVTSMLLGFGRH